MKLSEINLLLKTLQYITLKQFVYQIYYRFSKYFHIKHNYTLQKTNPLKWTETIQYGNSYFIKNTFCFLNLKKEFTEIDWNFNGFGKLWNYNLNYFSFLLQQNISKEQGIDLINDFINYQNGHKVNYEPYPISLRSITWIKFISVNQITDQKINLQLYKNYKTLLSNIEYHLMANHLLENGFSLLFGAYFFQSDKFYKKAQQIIQAELEKQFLNDGAHFELSPMYHQIILHRILDCYKLVSINPWKNHELAPILKRYAEKALGWLKQISFQNNQIPLLNDSTIDIALSTQELLNYANKLSLIPQITELKESGYRKFVDENFELIMDVGQIAPSYQPGHSHADSLQFVLNFNNNPIIVDTGISTYEKNQRRQLERSSISHNTIVINKTNSSRVWSGFRVAQRAKVLIQKDELNHIVASHDGYKNLGVRHIRTFNKTNNCITISDEIQGTTNKKKIEGHLHFHPNIKIELFENKLRLNNQLEIIFTGINQILIVDYKLAIGFNKLILSKKIIYTFDKFSTFTISPIS